MSKKNILVTGGAGFIGSNFINYFLEAHPETKLVNLDLLTYAGDLENLKGCEQYSNYTFIKGDICDVDLINSLFSQYKFNAVIHFAAESHVDNSISNPGAFIKTNIEGTFNLLHTAYRTWMDGPFKTKPEYQGARFHHISTDEVYGTLGETGLMTETTPYAPNSPYSASKASSDFIVRSYFHTYGMNVITTNCSNNYGPRQHNEKLIPTIIRKSLGDENIPIYGNGKNIRDWLYVLDHCTGIDKVFREGKSGETYNIGGHNEIQNIDICHTICDILDEVRPRADKKSYREQITYVSDRPGHDFRYAIDSTKMQKELNWVPKETFETGIKKTIDWYLKKFS